MNRWLRIGGWVALALVALWLVMEIVSIVFGIVSWLVSTAISIAVVLVLLYLVYLAVSRIFGGSGGSGGSRGRSQSRERDRVFE